MSLSNNAVKAIKNALADKDLGEEVANAIDSFGSGPAAEVAELGATADLSAVSPDAASITDSAGTFVDGNEPTGAEVDAAIDELRDKVETALDLKSDNDDIETLRGEVEARLDDIEAKVDEILAAMKAVDMMES